MELLVIDAHAGTSEAVGFYQHDNISMNIIMIIMIMMLTVY